MKLHEVIILLARAKGQHPNADVKLINNEGTLVDIKDDFTYSDGNVILLQETKKTEEPS